MDELLFQININPELSSKLSTESKMLLDAAEKLNKNSETRIYNYFREEWQFFANEAPIVEKPPQIYIKKADVIKDLGPSITNQIDTLKAVIA